MYRPYSKHWPQNSEKDKQVSSPQKVYILVVENKK